MATAGTPFWDIGKSRKMVCAWKIMDPREERAWDELENGNNAVAAALFRAVAEAQPRRSFPLIGESLARIGTKEFARAREALKAAESWMYSDVRTCLEQRMFFIKDQIYSYETVALARDFTTFQKSIQKRVPVIDDRNLVRTPAKSLSPADLSTINSLVSSVTFWPEVEKATKMRGRARLFPLGQKAMSLSAVQEAGPSPNAARESRTLCQLLMLKGHAARSGAKRDYQSAMHDYATAVRLGQNLRHGFLIDHLVGISCEAQGISGLRQMVEDGLITDQQTLDLFQGYIEYLDKAEPRYQPFEQEAYEFLGGFPVTTNPLAEGILATGGQFDFIEAEIRAATTLTELQILKGAVAVKREVQSTNYPPTFNPNLLPEDPFRPQQKIVYQGTGSVALVYSVGPDGRDDKGAVPYDPTNGSVSAGDIVLGLQ